MAKQNNTSIILIALAVSLGGFLFGFDASVISGVTKYIKPQFGLSDIGLGWVVSAPTFSAMFAMLVAGTVADRVGRKSVLVVVAFLYLLSAAWSAFAGSATELIIARMIGGVAFGAALILAPVYIAEIAPAKQRGRLVSIQQLNIVLGFSASYFSNYWFQTNLATAEWLTDTNIWRYMFGMEMLPAVIYFLALFVIPRSPRWLLSKGKTEEANRVLERFHGATAAEQEAKEIVASLEAAKHQPKVGLEALFSKKMTFVMSIALAIGILQQITGVNAIYFYAPTIFEASGVGANAAFAQAVWVGVINVIFTLVAMAFIDRFGRKPLLLIGLAGIALSMGLTSYGFQQATYTLQAADVAAIENLDSGVLEGLYGQTFNDDVTFKNTLKETLGESTFTSLEGDLTEAAIQMNPILILIGILGFVASFAVSLGPVMWVMLSEMFPNKIRGLAISVVGFVNSFTSWLVQLVFPWELTNLGNSLTFLFYAGFALIGVFIIYQFAPETKGKSLEELEKELVR